MTRYPLLLVILLLPAACSPSHPSQDSGGQGTSQDHSLTRQTQYGYVNGMDTGGDTWAWLGIPYAEPPIGELRWTPPQDPQPWEDLFVADGFCSGCTQYGGYFTYEDLAPWQPWSDSPEGYRRIVFDAENPM